MKKKHSRNYHLIGSNIQAHFQSIYSILEVLLALTIGEDDMLL